MVSTGMNQIAVESWNNMQEDQNKNDSKCYKRQIESNKLWVSFSIPYKNSEVVHLLEVRGPEFID